LKPFFGIKVLVAGLMLSPFIVVVIYFLIKPLPTEIPPDDIFFESGVQLHEGGLLDLAISEYDKAIEINRYNLQAHHKRADAYFAKGDLGHAMVDYNEAISLRSQLIRSLGSRERTAMLHSVSEAYMGKALIYAWQGRDLEAQKITSYAVDFGYDPVAAKAGIEGMIRRRDNNESLSTIGNNRPPP
jgi:tetratricopeptide (TPR) repeat protein